MRARALSRVQSREERSEAAQLDDPGGATHLMSTEREAVLAEQGGN